MEGRNRICLLILESYISKEHKVKSLNCDNCDNFLDTDLWGKGGEFPYAKILPKWKGIYQEVGGHEVSETMMRSDVELKVRLCQFNVFRPSPLATYPKLVVQQLHKGRLFLSYLGCRSSEVAMTHWPLELSERSLTMCIEATTEWSRQTGVSDTGY